MRDWKGPAQASAAPPHRGGRPRAVAGADPRALLARPDASAEDVLELQRLAGNEATASVLQRDEAASPGEAGPVEAPAAAPGEQALVEEAGAIIDGGGQLPFHSLYADLDGQATFVTFDDVPVQRLFRHLLARWFGDAVALENSPGPESPPPWVGEFRAKALNVRPQAAADNPGDARLAQLAGRLADSVAAETPAQRIRRQFVEETQQRVGTTVMTQAEIDAERQKTAEPGLTPANFTTCIAFFGQVMGQVTAKAGLAAPIVKGPNAYKEINPQAKESLGDRWKPAVPGARPKPGDLLIFTFNADEKNKDGSIKFGKGWFAHISILRSIEPAEVGTDGPQERWISIDGGGTTATETVRIFSPDTGLIKGPGSVTRRMKGWIDIEAAVEAGLAPKR